MTFDGRVEAQMTVPSGVTVTATAGGSTALSVPINLGTYFPSALVTTLQTQLNAAAPPASYPTTAAAMAAAIGYGTWSAGWLCDETSGSLQPAFGATALAPVSSPTYGAAGPRGGTDLAVGFDSAAAAFSAGDTFDVGTGDLIIAWVGFLASAGTDHDYFTKWTANPGWYVLGGGSSRMQFTIRDAGSTVNATSSGIVAGEWHVGIAVLDRSTNRTRIGTVGLSSGTSTVGAQFDVSAIGTLDNAASFLVGNGGITGNGPDTGLKLAGLYIATGASAATGLSANLSTALANFAAAINAGWTVALSTGASGTGKVTINCTGAPVSSPPAYSIAWTSTTLRDLLGFTADITAVTAAQTGAKQARGLWIPDVPFDLDGDPDSAPLMSDLRTTTSPTGFVLGLVGDYLYVHRNLKWEMVARARIWEGAATIPNSSWEYFFNETQLGRGASWFRPRSPLMIYTLAGTALGRYANSGAGISAGWSISSDDDSVRGVQPKQYQQGYTGAWTILIPTVVSSG